MLAAGAFFIPMKTKKPKPRARPLSTVKVAAIATTLRNTPRPDRRKIAKEAGVSVSTVNTIAAGMHPHQQPTSNARSSAAQAGIVFPNPDVEPVWCEVCQRRVQPPCLVCQITPREVKRKDNDAGLMTVSGFRVPLRRYLTGIHGGSS
jgi:hypothetical protein